MTRRALALVVVLACGGEGSDPLALSVVKDLSPDPSVVEIALEARTATKKFGSLPATEVWTYNGTVPGPLIDAKVGDRLVVHFRNALPEDTTIHWHGLRVPAAMDGTLAMQRAIPPGGSFEYAFTLKDAGLFWFHPHVRSDVQIERGLAGVIRVRGSNEPVVDDERVLVLDDIKLEPDGTFPTHLDHHAKMLGREGNTILVNGVTNAVIPLRAGSLVRWRIVNVANGRFFNLKLPGHTWHVIGKGGGFVPAPWDEERLLIVPGERYDVVFIAGAPGELKLVSEPYERGHSTGARPSLDVAKVRISGEALHGRTVPSPGAALTPHADGPPDVTLALGEMVMPNGDVHFTINGRVHPDVPVVKVPNGASRILEVKNESEMDHPFHLHGFFFQVISRSGAAVPSDRLHLEDTINVPMKSSVKLGAIFDEPGTWMYHCHINEHGEHGMMGELHVE